MNNIQSVGEYKNLIDLHKKLTKMKENIVYSITLGAFTFYMFYNKENKYSLLVKGDKAIISKEKINYKQEKIKTKVFLFQKLRIVIDKLSKYNRGNDMKSEVNLFDLENIEEEFKLDNSNSMILLAGDELKEIERKEAKILNYVLLSHNIFTKNKENEPTKTDNKTYLIKVNSIDISELTLFPEENIVFKHKKIDIESYPNIYFPSIVNIIITKTLVYKGYTFIIKYNVTNTIKFFATTIQEYYDYYKIKMDVLSKNNSKEMLFFITSFFSILRNPYSGVKNNKGTGNESYIKSNCPKCGSSSSIFKVDFGRVNIETEMSSFGAATLYCENIKDYKDIIKICCLECDNVMYKNVKLLCEIKGKRRLLKRENWVNPIDNIPLLDNPNPTSVIVRYDIVSIETEFDMTDPLDPNLEYTKILEVGNIVGWRHKELNSYTNFYKNGI